MERRLYVSIQTVKSFFVELSLSDDDVIRPRLGTQHNAAPWDGMSASVVNSVAFPIKINEATERRRQDCTLILPSLLGRRPAFCDCKMGQELCQHAKLNVLP